MKRINSNGGWIFCWHEPNFRNIP